MSRVAILNMVLGFWWIFLASCGGFFLAQYRQQVYISGGDPIQLLEWWMVLQKSAHAHTNLFGMIHILVGLTMPYSLISKVLKICLTGGLAIGSFTMSILVFVHAHLLPETIYSWVSVMIGVGLSLWLVSVAIHVSGLMIKWQRMGI